MDWSRNTLGNSKTKLNEKKAALKELSRENKVDHMQRIRTLKSEINTILHQDELFWQQRSRSIWFPARDKNTKLPTNELASGVVKIIYQVSRM